MPAAPFVAADGAPLSEKDPSWSLSVFQRLSATNTLAASLERTPKSGTHLSAGGTRQLSDTARLRGKWGTNGLLALALEMAGERSSLALVSEVHCSGALSPKFGASLSVQP